jgi:hypothetical protein
MNGHAMVFPCAALIGLTAIVWLRALYERVSEMRTRRIPPQALANSRDRQRALRDTQARDNFSNLLEVPILSYILCLVLILTDRGTPGFVVAAWVFVASRAIHSLIHITYNRVMHRFAAYVLSTVWLYGMWGAFVWTLLSATAGNTPPAS